MHIHLIRHTTPNIAKGVCYGQSDIDVCDSFLQEVARIKTKTLSQYDALYTSPLQRCTKLAKHFNARERYTENALMEYHFGDWEGATWAELTSQAARNWMDNFVEVPTPNGESLRDMQTRVLNFFSQLLQKNYERVVLISHAGVQRIIFAHIMQSPLHTIFNLQLSFGTVMEIQTLSDRTTIQQL